MNKQEFQSWKQNPVTKLAIKEIELAVIEAKEISVVDMPMDMAASKAIYREGVADGVEAFKVWIEDTESALKDESNED